MEFNYNQMANKERLTIKYSHRLPLGKLVHSASSLLHNLPTTQPSSSCSAIACPPISFMIR